MKFLVDTHALVWFLFDDPRLSERARNLILQADSRVSLSIASLWEIGIKVSIGKLNLGLEFDEFLNEFILGRDL
jgi:PIN domain nuclease of toxin-antitoxin system